MKYLTLSLATSKFLRNRFFNKQLLDEVFVISRIIRVEVRVISRSRRLRLITLTENEKKLKSCFCFFADGKQHKACELDMITLRNHALRSYMT